MRWAVWGPAQSANAGYHLRTVVTGSSFFDGWCSCKPISKYLGKLFRNTLATFDCFQLMWTKTPVSFPNAAECPKKHKPKAFFDIVANTQEWVAKATTCPPGARCRTLFPAMPPCHFWCFCFLFFAFWCHYWQTADKNHGIIDASSSPFYSKQSDRCGTWLSAKRFTTNSSYRVCKAKE